MREQFDISGVFETTEFEIAKVACKPIINYTSIIFDGFTPLFIMVGGIRPVKNPLFIMRQFAGKLVLLVNLSIINYASFISTLHNGGWYTAPQKPSVHHEKFCW